MAFRLLRRSAMIRQITGFWPGGVGVHTKPANRAAKRLGKALHAPHGVVVRVSLAPIERQLSAAAQMPLPSAAVRDQAGQIVTDMSEAMNLVIDRIEERLQNTPVAFIRETRHGAARLRQHSTMVSVGKHAENIVPFRHGSVDFDDLFRAARSRDGVDWSSST